MNKFKIGDKVRVYYGGANKPHTGIIKMIRGDMFLVSPGVTIECPHSMAAHYETHFHYKQCRKLKPKPKNHKLLKMIDELIDSVTCNAYLPRITARDAGFNNGLDISIREILKFKQRIIDDENN